MSKASELKQCTIEELQAKMKSAHDMGNEVKDIIARLEKKRTVFRDEENRIRKQIYVRVCAALQQLINADIKCVYYANNDLTEFTFKRKGQKNIEGVCLEDCTYVDLCNGKVVHTVDMSAQLRHRIRLMSVGEELLQET